MVRATVLIKAKNGNDNGLPRHQTRMPKTETQIWLKQDEGSNRTSSFGPKWYTIAPPHRYIFSPALTWSHGDIPRCSRMPATVSVEKDCWNEGTSYECKL